MLPFKIKKDNKIMLRENRYIEENKSSVLHK